MIRWLPIYWLVFFCLASLASMALADEPPSQMREWRHPRVQAAVILFSIGLFGFSVLAYFVILRSIA